MGLQSAKMGEMIGEQILAGAPAPGSGLLTGAQNALGAMAPGLGKLFSGGGFDPVGSQGNPLFPADIAPGSFPGGPAIGGGRMPLNG